MSPQRCGYGFVPMVGSVLTRLYEAARQALPSDVRAGVDLAWHPQTREVTVHERHPNQRGSELQRWRLRLVASEPSFVFERVYPPAGDSALRQQVSYQINGLVAGLRKKRAAYFSEG